MPYNWGVDTKRLKKDKEAFQKWQTEQLVNFGLRRGKLSKSYLKRNLKNLNIDPSKKNFLTFLIWPSRS